jgi:hypothetical protein
MNNKVLRTHTKLLCQLFDLRQTLLALRHGLLFSSFGHAQLTLRFAQRGLQLRQCGIGAEQFVLFGFVANGFQVQCKFQSADSFALAFRGRAHVANHACAGVTYTQTKHQRAP